MAESTLRVVDFETTGLPPEAAVCEVGWQDVVIRDGELALSRRGGMLVNPCMPIPPEASAVHHLTDADVSGAETVEKAYLALMDGADIFVAHNAAFERAFFGGGDRPWICTLKVALRIWPEAPSHSNQVLRYWRNLPVINDIAAPPHRAVPDAYVTGWLLIDLLSTASIDDMVRWTQEPSLLPRVTFGKHRGKAWSELPSDYLDWIVNKSDLDDDTKFTARYHLKKAAA